MSISVLTTPNISRRYCATHLDSHNRLMAYEDVYDNATHTYDTSHGTTLERYDPATMLWTTLTERVPPMQSFGSCIDATDHLYRVAGQDVSATTTGDIVDIYDSASNSWSSSVNLPAPVSPAPVVWIDQLGALRVAGATGLTTGFLWQFSGGAWVALAAAPFPGEFQGGSAFVDSSNRAYLFGSPVFTPLTSTLVQIYNPAADTWATTTAPFALAYGTVSLDDVNQVIYGVLPNTVASTTTVATCAYTIASGTWATLATLTIPTAAATPVIGGWLYDAATHACYCTGVISGSSTGTSDLNIYRYDVATDTWSTTGDALSAARFPTAYRRIQFDGTGYYLPQGALNVAGGHQDAVNVFEYFIPGGVIASVRPRRHAQIIGD